MYNTPAMTTTLPISEVRSKLAKLVDLANSLSQKTYITVKGKVKAALISAEDLESMEETLDVLSNKEEVEAIEKGIQDIKKGNLISWEEIKKDMAL